MGNMRMAASSVLLMYLSLIGCDPRHGQFTRLQDLLSYPSLAQAGHCGDEVACHFECVQLQIGLYSCLLCLPIRSAYVHIRRLRIAWYML